MTTPSLEAALTPDHWYQALDLCCLMQQVINRRRDGLPANELTLDQLRDCLAQTGRMFLDLVGEERAA